MIDLTGPPIMSARGLTKDYERHGSAVRVVDTVDLSIWPGETLGLVGESGSGKSTVARMLLLLVQPTTGSVLFKNENLLDAPQKRMRELRRSMQIVFQDPYAALNPRMTVREILQEPFQIHGSPSGPPNLSRLDLMLGEVGLDGSALGRYPHEFSGGQRQRVNIARALALQPEFVVLDEPISALDVSVGAQIVNLLRDLQKRHGLTYLFISHSMPLVRYLCNRVAVMQRGKLIEIGDAAQVCAEPREEYTRGLVAATPEMPDRSA